MCSSDLQLIAPGGFVVLSCRDIDEEFEITEKLVRNHINYRRSDNDIEIMTINAGGNNE